MTYGDCSSDRMAISWIISSTSSSALSISMTLIATAWPVRLSTLNSLAKFGRCGSYYRRRTLCKLCRNCHHLRHVSTFTPKCPSAQAGVARHKTTSGLTNAVFLGVEKLRVKRFIRVVNLMLAICHCVGSWGSLCFRVTNDVCPAVE